MGLMSPMAAFDSLLQITATHLQLGCNFKLVPSEAIASHHKHTLCNHTFFSKDAESMKESLVHSDSRTCLSENLYRLQTFEWGQIICKGTKKRSRNKETGNGEGREEIYFLRVVEGKTKEDQVSLWLGSFVCHSPIYLEWSSPVLEIELYLL